MDNKVFEEGVEAANEGRTFHQNPYLPLAEQWDSGYRSVIRKSMKPPTSSSKMALSVIIWFTVALVSGIIAYLVMGL